MLGKLVPCGGGVPVPLVSATMVIGRHPNCDVAIPCQTISSRHCELQFNDGSWWVRDLGSKTGTTVNGVPCEHQSVAPNDVLAFGRHRYILAYQPVPKQRPKPAANQDGEARAYLARNKPAAAPPRRPPAPGPALAAPPPARTRQFLGNLLPCGGGDPIPLVLAELTVGRTPACDIFLSFPAVSVRHCKLTWRDGWWFVEDLNSGNGTWVNGVRCQKECLPPGSVVAFAKHCFTIHYVATGDAPAPNEANV